MERWASRRSTFHQRVASTPTSTQAGA